MSGTQMNRTWKTLVFLALAPLAGCISQTPTRTVVQAEAKPSAQQVPEIAGDGLFETAIQLERDGQYSKATQAYSDAIEKYDGEIQEIDKHFRYNDAPLPDRDQRLDQRRRYCVAQKARAQVALQRVQAQEYRMTQ